MGARIGKAKKNVKRHSSSTPASLATCHAWKRGRQLRESERGRGRERERAAWRRDRTYAYFSFMKQQFACLSVHFSTFVLVAVRPPTGLSNCHMHHMLPASSNKWSQAIGKHLHAHNSATAAAAAAANERASEWVSGWVSGWVNAPCSLACFQLFVNKCSPKSVLHHSRRSHWKFALSLWPTHAS